MKGQYTEHGLQVIRFANGQTRAVNIEIRNLASRIRSAINASYGPDSSREEINAMLTKVRRDIMRTYAGISAAQREVLDEFFEVEVNFATKTAAIRGQIPEGRRTKLKSNLLIYGATPEEHWDRHARNLAWNVTSSVRAAHASGTERRTLLAQVVGSGAAGRELGGLIEGATKAARSLVDSSMQSARQAAHVAAFKVKDSNIKAMEWFAILDSSVCSNCAMRAGKLYTIEGKPIGHSIAMVSPPPMHPFCRCMLIPKREAPEDGGKNKDRFENWLEKQPQDKQEDLLGAGRTQLWREGKLTLSQLIGQDGLVMSMEELKRKLAIP